MKIRLHAYIRFLLIGLLLVSAGMSILSQAAYGASGDLAMDDSSVWFSSSQFLEGQSVRIWASVQNNSPSDLLGSVRFTSKDGTIDSDQAISALAGKTDEVFVDWIPPSYGEYVITVTVIPWDGTSDNPDNNVVQKSVYVEQDTDRDGVANISDADQDGDGVSNEEDAFPLTYSESEDTDGDGQGNNADADDDNDGTSDSEDQLPEDPNYTKDQDGDGIPDEEDEDSDGDGLSNEQESQVGTEENNADSDGDGSTDGVDVFPTNSSESQDTDHDGTGDKSDTDLDGDGAENGNDVDPYDPAPSAEANQDVIITDVGEEVLLDGSTSKDDTHIVKYIWEVGESTLEGAVISVPFDSTGLQVATLTVFDEKGQTDSTKVKVRVFDYSFLLQATAFSVLLLLLAFALITRYTRPAPKKISKKSSKKNI